MTEREIVPWFGGDPITVQSLGDDEKVAYSWSSLAGVPDEPKIIDHLLVWHDCDHSVMLANPEVTHPETIRPFIGWHPTGVGAHDLITADPLHIEASVYWPSCCGMHGWIRGGAWVSA